MRLHRLLTPLEKRLIVGAEAGGTLAKPSQHFQLTGELNAIATKAVSGVELFSLTADKPNRRGQWIGPVYPTLRLDLTFSQALAAVVRLSARNPRRWQTDIEAEWMGGDAVAFLSVRSAFTALLEALGWPMRSEILITGINITDMTRIIESFGYIPVPIDVDPATLAPDPSEIAEKIGPATRGIVVAQLFGGHSDITPLLDVARRHGLIVIEDSAQAFTTRAARGCRQSDVRLFSFGLLKTGTALGGAVVEVGNAKLRQAVREIQSSWSRQPRWSYAARIAKAFMMLLLQRPAAYGLFSRLCAAAGSSSGAVVRRFTRGFGNDDTAALLQALRQQPCAPLLAMLAWRLTTDDGSRVARRAEIGERIIEGLEDLPEARVNCLGHAQTRRTHWLLPMSVPDPDGLRRDLALAGVDAHGASNVVAIGGRRATAMIDGLVFVPCYPELSDDARARLCDVVRAHCTASRSRIGLMRTKSRVMYT